MTMLQVTQRVSKLEKRLSLRLIIIYGLFALMFVRMMFINAHVKELDNRVSSYKVDIGSFYNERKR